MLFRKPKPTVTPEDKDWVEEAMLWLEGQYSREWLKAVPIVEPTKDFFPIDFRGTEENARQIVDIVREHMDIRDHKVEVNFFSLAESELAPLVVTRPQSSNPGFVGLYSHPGFGKKHTISIEKAILKDPMNLISTIVHELSHLILLGQNRLQKNDEYLTDLNIIAMGFGIYKANSIFGFTQHRDTTSEGWRFSGSGYIPQEVATYAMALLTNYQQKHDNWKKYLNPSPKRMYERNMKYLRNTKDEIRFV